MSATLAPATTPRPAPAPPAPEAPAVEIAGREEREAEAEMHRWLVGLVTPFVLGSIFFALSIATPAYWLIGVALMLGPVLFMFMAIYLCISSDSNGSPPSRLRVVAT